MLLASHWPVAQERHLDCHSHSYYVSSVTLLCSLDQFGLYWCTIPSPECCVAQICILFKGYLVHMSNITGRDPVLVYLMLGQMTLTTLKPTWTRHKYFLIKEVMVHLIFVVMITSSINSHRIKRRWCKRSCFSITKQFDLSTHFPFNFSLYIYFLPEADQLFLLTALPFPRLPSFFEHIPTVLHSTWVGSATN